MVDALSGAFVAIQVPVLGRRVERWRDGYPSVAVFCIFHARVTRLVLPLYEICRDSFTRQYRGLRSNILLGKLLLELQLARKGVPLLMGWAKHNLCDVLLVNKCLYILSIRSTRLFVGMFSSFWDDYFRSLSSEFADMLVFRGGPIQQHAFLSFVPMQGFGMEAIVCCRIGSSRGYFPLFGCSYTRYPWDDIQYVEERPIATGLAIDVFNVRERWVYAGDTRLCVTANLAVLNCG